MMLHLAGKRYWYASVIEHTGRQSGRRYSTPIVADRVGEDIIVVRSLRCLGAAIGFDDEHLVFVEAVEAWNIDGAFADGGGERVDHSVALLLVGHLESVLLHDLPQVVPCFLLYAKK